MTITAAKLRRVLILVGILIALALPLMFMLKDFVREAIVLPFAYQAWIVGIVVDALPQGLFLGAAVLIGILIAGRSLRRSRTTVQSVQARTHRSDGSVRIWLERVDRVSAGTYSRDRFGHYIGQFLLRAIAYEERLSAREVRHHFDSGGIDLPESVRGYLDLTQQPASPGRRTWFQRVKQRLLGLVQRRRTRRVTPDELWAETDIALSYIERQLRIQPAEADSEQ